MAVPLSHALYTYWAASLYQTKPFAERSIPLLISFAICFSSIPLAIAKILIGKYRPLLISNHLHFRLRREVFENLSHIDLGVVAGKGAVPEDGPEGLSLGHGSDHGVRHISVKAGHEGAVIHIVDGAAVNNLAGVGQVNLHAPVQQAGVEQIQVGAILLDVGHHATDGLLGVFLRVVVHIPHVALIHPEDPETGVQRGIQVLGPDFVPRPADAFLADLADIFIT